MQENLFRRNAILVESDFLQGELYKDILYANGFDVHLSKTALDAIQDLKSKECDVLIINIDNNQEYFIAKLLKKIRSEYSNLLIVGMSIYPKEHKEQIISFLDIFFIKPFFIESFIEAIESALEKNVQLVV